MTRWEYMVLDVGVAGFFRGPELDGDALTSALNEYGRQGWEVVGLTGIHIGEGSTKDLVIILKRSF
jgi:hypothetical protein